MAYVETRPIRSDDEDAAIRLIHQLIARGDTAVASEAGWRQVFRTLVDSARGYGIAAVEDGILLGVITASVNLALRYGGDYAQIEELVVDEAGRGKGVGALLVNAAVDEARDRGCKEIGLYSREHTRAFYEKYGFSYRGPELRLALV